MARRDRDYSREYQRRNELAKQRGFKSYGQQRRYTEYTATPVRYLGQVTPEDLLQVYERSAYDYEGYEYGEDKLLDAWIRRSEGRGIDAEEAFASYKRRARGGQLTRRQIGRLSQELYGEDWNEKWSTS